MGHPCWIYHDTEQKKVIDSDDRESMLADGWRSHPDRQNNPANLEAEDKLNSLKITAKALGIKVDGRSTIQSLTKLIDEHDSQDC